MSTKKCVHHMDYSDCPEWAGFESVICKGYKTACPFYTTKSKCGWCDKCFMNLQKNRRDNNGSQRI